MMHKLKRFSLLLCGSLLCGAAWAQQPLTEHTFKLTDPEARPAASIDAVDWLVGAWEGEAFGQQFEEVWNPASAGTMVGFFKLLNGSDITFYELLLLAEEEGSLVLKVKHFNPDFSAWEEKQDYITFRFIAADEDAIHFSGLSFYRDGDDAMTGYIVMRSGDKVREEKLTYRRVSLP